MAEKKEKTEGKTSREEAQEEKAQEEEPRIGVYICHCGTNIAGTVDCQKVAQEAGDLDNVVVSKDYKFMCSDPGQKLIKDDIEENNLNRVVVAACSPRMHEPTFRAAVEEAGMNPFLFEQANIREHDSWVHMKQPKEATEKANELTRMSIARARKLTPQERPKVQVEDSALVIGGGVSGIQSALDLAEMGFKVYLVEKTPSLGGKMALLDKTFPTMDCSACILTPRMVEVDRHPNIEVLTYSEVKEVDGYIGNYKVKIEKKARQVSEKDCTGCGLCVDACPVEVPSEFDEGLGVRKAIYVPFPQAVPLVYTIDDEACLGCGMCAAVCGPDAIDYEQEPENLELDVGTVVVATGFDTFDASRKEEYGYGKYENVVTGMEFERMVNASGPTGGKLLRPSDGKEPHRIGFVLCVGSRDAKIGNNYCSRVCCMYSIKNARLYKEKHPETEIYIFYMDIRAFGKGYEEFYRQAQEDYGIKFVRGRPGEIVEEPRSKNPQVRVEDTLLGEPLEVDLDMVVLATGMEPARDSENVQRLLRLSRSADGFFAEAHPKLGPVDTLNDGVYLAGTCQGPKDIPDSVAQASAAAAHAGIPMGKGVVEIEPIVAYVDKEKCIGCRICERTCDFNVINMKDRKAEVNEAICKGCGACAAACPTGAMQIKHFTDEQIFNQIEAAFKEA